MLKDNHDWIESLRRRVWPKLHPVLKPFGGYAVGRVGPDQYVGTSYIDEEALETELVALGFRRNPVSCFKYHTDGRPSTGSWVLRPEHDPVGGIDDGYHLHATLFESPGGQGCDIYAHYEYDWRTHPLKHLREVNFDPVYGASYCRSLLADESFIDV